MKRGIAEFSRLASGVALAAAIVLTAADPADASQRLYYANGITATVYAPGELAAQLTTYQGAPAIALPDGRILPVITDINDPSIYNKGDGEFHPFTLDLVDHTLSAITHPSLSLSVRVYLLPYPRTGSLVSSTTGNEIFLSPHVLDIDPAVAAYIIAHEFGHVVHNRYMPANSSQWTDYRVLRGIQDQSIFNDTAAHAYRPREIFAEDFRVLFGGPDARFAGHVENTEITEPEAVYGLADYFVAMTEGRAAGARLNLTSSPNPFNPDTEIHLTVPGDAVAQGTRVSIRIYSVTGALVRDLYSGVPSGDLSVRWDGRDNRGAAVASSTYYAQVRMGAEHETLKLMLLK